MRAAAALLAGLLLAVSASAETVTLNDGSVLKGRIVKADAGAVTLETPDGLLELHKERIKSIDYGAAPAAEPAPAPAAEPEAPAAARRPRRTRFFGSLELMTASNADHGLKDDVAAAGRGLSGAGYSGTYSIKTDGAVALRVGLRGDVTDRFDLGFSVGFIGGPNSDVTAAVSNGVSSAALVDKREITFVRFLAEPTGHFPLSRNASFHMGAGLGVARGGVNEKVTCTGTACTSSGVTREFSSNWTGFTWEVSPYVSVDKLLLGFRWAGMPRFGGNANNSKVEWTSASFFAGIQF